MNGTNKHLDSIVKSYSAKLLNSVCESIRIPSIYSPATDKFPYGLEIARAAEHAMKEASKLGFQIVDLDGKVAWADFGEGTETLAVMGHLDVVEPGDGWDFDPFCGIIDNEYILGRGAQDDKGPVFSSLYALRSVADLNVPLKRKIRIIFGLDEETGKMRDVEAYLNNEAPPVMAFTPDGEFPVVNTEKGAIKFRAYKKFIGTSEKLTIVEIKGGRTIGSVPELAYAKLESKDYDALKSAYVILKNYASSLSWEVLCTISNNTLIVSVKGKAAHATLPGLGVNAIGRLLILLSQINISSCQREYIAFLAKNFGMDTEGKLLGINSSHSHSGSLTLNLAVINGNQNEISLQIGIYVPANTIPFDFVCSRVENLFNEKGAILDFISKIPPLYVEEDSILIRKLKTAYFNATQKEPRVLSMCGTTYSKKMPNMVPFGATFSDEDDRAHAANERVLISNLLESTRIMAYAILEMAR